MNEAGQKHIPRRLDWPDRKDDRLLLRERKVRSRRLARGPAFIT